MKLRIVAAALALTGLGLFGAGVVEAETCSSTGFMGCMFAGVELMALGMLVGGAAAVVLGLDILLRWRASRRPPMPSTLAEIEAEIRSIEAELAKLSRTGS